MRKLLILFLILMLSAAILFLIQKYFGTIDKQNSSIPDEKIESPVKLQPNPNAPPVQAPANDSEGQADIQPPLDQPKQRITKKMFGTFVTPKNSPVKPERFYGYHTGVDFETFLEEKDSPVEVHAVCRGKLVEKKYAKGYGGLAVQLCQLNGSPITVVYGHLKLTSIYVENGKELKTGDEIGILGQGYTSETDGERKHLHLGFHKGSAINILGYVSSASQLSAWIDPCMYVCGK